MLNYFKSASCLFDLNSIATTKKNFLFVSNFFKSLLKNLNHMTVSLDNQESIKSGQIEILLKESLL